MECKSFIQVSQKDQLRLPAMDNQSNKLQLFKNVSFSQNTNRVNHSFSVNKPENNKMNNSFHVKLPEIQRMSIKTRDQNELKINTMHTLKQKYVTTLNSVENSPIRNEKANYINYSPESLGKNHKFTRGFLNLMYRDNTLTAATLNKEKTMKRLQDLRHKEQRRLEEQQSLAFRIKLAEFYYKKHQIFVSQEKVNKLSENELLHILESKRTTIMQEQKVIYIQRTYRQIQADYREKLRQQQIQQEMELQRRKNECAFRIQKRWRIVQKKLQEELMIRKAAATQVLQKFIKKRQVKMRLERERQQKLLEEQMRQHQRESAQIKIRYYWRRFKKQVLSQKNKNKNNKNAGKQTNKNQANKRGGLRGSSNAQQYAYNPKNVVPTHKTSKLQQ